ncbi:BON domain-containing protein [Neisseria sp. Ec49-e6-T10]|uniref:BON domain-containing protein n=1 Tax=Neisseria sp. Ec49-e6-T10 TaxID=3140744 RepID=UPI003EBBEC1A
MLKKTKLIVLVCALSIGLSGCPALLIGGAVGGAKVGFDRRSTGAQTDDNAIDLKVAGQINNKINETRTSDAPKASVTVVTYNRASLLLGMVQNEEEQQIAERIVRAQPNVRRVYNQITISPDGRSFGNMSRDSWITSKVRTTILGAKGVSPNHVKVVTYNGVTYVMGILTPEEQAAATAAISQTSGVQKVVTLFETFTE